MAWVHHHEAKTIKLVFSREYCMYNLASFPGSTPQLFSHSARKAGEWSLVTRLCTTMNSLGSVLPQKILVHPDFIRNAPLLTILGSCQPHLRLYQFQHRTEVEAQYGNSDLLYFTHYE